MLLKLSKAWRVLKMRRQLIPVVLNQLIFLESQGNSVWGSITEEDEKGIIGLTEKAGPFPGPIIEIGALFGFTTQLIATYKPIEKKTYSGREFFMESLPHTPGRPPRDSTTGPQVCY